MLAGLGAFINKIATSVGLSWFNDWDTNNDGTEITVDTNGRFLSYNAVTTMGTDEVWVAYSDVDKYPWVRKFTLSDTTPSYDYGVKITGMANYNISKIVKLTDTKAVLYARRATTTFPGKAVVVTDTGSSLSWSTIYDLDTTRWLEGSIERVDDTTLISTFKGVTTSNYPTAQVLSVSGNVITGGTKYTLQSTAAGSSVQVIPTPVGTNKFVLLWADNANTIFKGVVATVSGTTLSFGTTYSLWTGSEEANLISGVGDYNPETGIGCFTSRGLNTEDHYIYPFKVSGDVITAGTRYTLRVGDCRDPKGCIHLGDDYYHIQISDSDNMDQKGVVIHLDAATNTVDQVGTTYLIRNSSGTQIYNDQSMCVVDDTRLAVALQNDTNNSAVLLKVLKR